MKRKQYGIGSGGAFAWYFQRITGLILIITLLLHYLYLHFLNGGNVTFQEVTQRLSTPLWKTIDLVFLVSVVYHAMQGILMVVNDYVHRPALRSTLVAAVWVLGMVLTITGVVTIVTFTAA